ncbi:uncharacterized protein LOC121423189 [Lytechinus variegatus]|uniref:uncharacterized protein LOC121423189 n=1 Tax=Lytechinus variegatus TaxID=7654 RepID=UPI001BB0E1C9|nr:uncharacterized protein LOC121423189 [Lytechinus variegatus]
MAEDNDELGLYMDFEDFVEDEDDELESDERNESTDEDENGSWDSWEDVTSTSDDGGEIGEEGVVDAEVPRPAGGEVPVAPRPRVPQPYLHEPLPRDGDVLVNDGDAHQQDVEPLRLLNNDWCLCGGHCHVEPSFSAGDCLCCREVAEVSREADVLGVQCLTTTEAFEAAILHPTSLYIGWLEYTERWRQASKAFKDRNNEKYRYVAYRKVVRWCWGYLGKDIRVQIPACIHSRIMRSYPDGAGRYRGTVLRVLRR